MKFSIECYYGRKHSIYTSEIGRGEPKKTSMVDLVEEGNETEDNDNCELNEGKTSTPDTTRVNDATAHQQSVDRIVSLVLNLSKHLSRENDTPNTTLLAPILT